MIICCSMILPWAEGGRYQLLAGATPDYSPMVRSPLPTSLHSRCCSCHCPEHRHLSTHSRSHRKFPRGHEQQRYMPNDPTRNLAETALFKLILLGVATLLPYLVYYHSKATETLILCLVYDANLYLFGKLPLDERVDRFMNGCVVCLTACSVVESGCLYLDGHRLTNKL